MAYLRTVTTVFAQTPTSTDATAVQSHLTTLLADLDTAVTNGTLGALVRDQLHDNLVAWAEQIATNLHAS